MELAWRAAEHLGSTPALPAFLQADTLRKANARRAVFLMEVESAIEGEIEPIREGKIAPLVIGGKVTTVAEYKQLIGSHVPALADRFAQNLVIAEITARLLPDMRDPVMRVSVSLRLFAGYLDAAKIIADVVRGRKNDAETRKDEMPSVDARAKNDPIYAVGFQAAPFYKRAVLEQDIFKHGIPAGSIVLQDWID
jgi:hypothetical protein